MHDDIEQVLLPEAEILRGIERVAVEVTESFRGSDFTVISVLKGSCIFASDLIRRIPIPLDLAFVAARSYGAGTTSGSLEIQLMPSREELFGRRVLLIDDILDTGRTLSAVRQRLEELGAADVKVCVFLDKPARRVVPFQADFCCFEIDDLFVVGYGLDYLGRYRNLPFVGSLRAEITTSPAASPAE